MIVIYKLLITSGIILLLLFFICGICGLGHDRFFDTVVDWIGVWLCAMAVTMAISLIKLIWTEL